MFIRFLKNSFFAKKTLFIVITLFVMVSTFCINVMFGYSESLYYDSLNATKYSTITFSNMDDITKSEDLLKCVQEITGYKVGSVLYFNDLGNMSTLIGWDGVEDTRRWGAHISGRRFTNEEMTNGKDVIYMTYHDYESKELSIGDNIIIDDTEYDVIGVGFLYSGVFLDAVGSDCKQTVIGQDLAQHTKELQSYVMTPYKTFIKNGYQPDLVLLHFVDINRSQYLDACEKVRTAFPNCNITVSSNSSDYSRFIMALSWVPFGVIMALIVGISLLNITSIWISEQRQIAYVYQICGLSKSRIKLYFFLEILVFSIIGEVLALTAQLLLKYPLSLIFVDRMPNVLEIITTALLVFALLSAASCKRIDKNLKFQGGIGE